MAEQRASWRSWFGFEGVGHFCRVDQSGRDEPRGDLAGDDGQPVVIGGQGPPVVAARAIAEAL
ncbi:MAG: hypothetical protein QOF12_451, partial [Solirubrobacteraceae bacterium]|nr:hypothetical protein [Solirubrobacteraceae bacterium]